MYKFKLLLRKKGGSGIYYDLVQLRACNLMARISLVIFGKLSYLVNRGEIKHDDYGMNANEGEFPVAATITQLIVPNRTITRQFLRCLCIFLPRRPTFDHSFPLIISHISQETYFILSTTQFRSVIRNTRHYQVYRWIIAFVSSSISGHSSLLFIIS